MATASQNQSNQISILPFIVFGVLSLLFGWIAATVLPDLPEPYRILPVQASVESIRTDNLFRILMGIGGVVFFLVQSLIYYAAIAFRANPDDTTDAPSIHGNMMLEIVWTLIPSLIVVFLAIISFDVWRDNTAVADNLNAVNGDSISINAVGQRFAWSFEYISNDYQTYEDGSQGNRIIFSTPDLYVYAGQKVELTLETYDVIHSFWVPAMRVKQDLLPGRTSRIRFEPRDPGHGWKYVMVSSPITIYAEKAIDADVLWEATVGAGEMPQPYPFELADPDATITLNEGQEMIWVSVITAEGTGYLPISADTAIGHFNKYRLVCAELCGGGHGDMYNEVIMFEDQSSFEMTWYNPLIAVNSVPAANPIVYGESIIASYPCSGCHQLSAFPNWSAVTGPNLTGIADRAYSSSLSTEKATGNQMAVGAEYIVQSLRQSQDYLVAGYPAIMTYFTPDLMPQEDLMGIVAFLCTQTASANPADSTCGLENWEFDADGNFTGDVDALVEELTLITNEYE